MAARSELDKLKASITEVQKKLREAAEKTTSARKIVDGQKALVTGVEMVEKVEEAMKACSKAEMPFLKGMEVLPKDDSDKALGDSKKHSEEASKGIAAAKTFLNKYISSAKSYPAELAQQLTDQLKPLLPKIDALAAKLADFRKETAERIVAAWNFENTEIIKAVEKQVDAYVEVTTLFKPEKLDETSVEDIRACIEKATPLAKAAKEALAETFKQVTNNKPGADVSAALQKIKSRLESCQSKLRKEEQMVQMGEKFIKAKGVVVEQEVKLKAVEADADKVAALAPAEGKKMTVEKVKAMDEGMAAAIQALKQVQMLVQPHALTAPTKLKAALQGLLDRKKAAQEKLENAKASAKIPREAALSAVYVADNKAVADVLKAALLKCSDAESVFLKGVEVLPLKDMQDAVAASEAAAKELQDAISKCKENNMSSLRKIKEAAFGDDAAKPVKEVCAETQTKISEAAKTLSEFVKETSDRKRVAVMQEIGLKIDAVEADVKTVLAAAEPFAKEDAKEWSEEAATKPLEVYLAAETAMKTKVAQTRELLGQVQRDGKKLDEVKKLQARLAEVTAAVAPARKPIAVHEDKFKGKKFVADAKAAVATLEADVKKAAESCNPLLVDLGVEYLITCSIEVLAHALTANGKEKSLDIEAIYKDASGGKKFSAKKFESYLAGLGAAIGHEEVNFDEARRTAVFKRLDVDKDGFVSKDEFKAIFKRKGTVKKEITVTDGFSVADSKVVATVAAGETVDLVGAEKEDDAKMVRCECKLKDGTACWITLKQENSVLVHFQSKAFKEFCTPLDQALNECDAILKKASATMDSNTKECGPATSGPLKEAKDEIIKVRAGVHTSVTALKELRQKVQTAKDAVKEKERAEKHAHIEAKEIAEAMVIYGAAIPKCDAAEAAALAVEAAAEPLAKLKTQEEIGGFATPASLSKEVETLAATAAAKADDAKAAIKEVRDGEGLKITPATTASTRAKKELSALSAKVEKAAASAKRTVVVIAKKCESVAEAYVALASKAFRDEALKKKVTVDKLFEELAKNGKVEEAAFGKKLVKLGLKEEPAKLVFQRVAGAGMDLRVFLSFVQVYYTVQKPGAITDKFDVTASETKRKVEKGEIFEVLEGPTKDEANAVERIRARAVLDGETGWVSISGNQGTPFLSISKKPWYHCRKDITMDKAAKAEGGSVRELKDGEILELVKGPYKEVIPDLVRAKVKVSKDNVQGWVTIQDRSNTVFAQSNPKLYVCKSAVVITDTEDITSSKVLRKLNVGETIETETEQPVLDATSGIARIKGKATKDGKEGWITTKGNAGTVFLEVEKKNYAIVKDVELTKAFAESAEVVRKLEVGEAVEVLEGPRNSSMPAVARIEVRAMSDKAIGWVTEMPEYVKLWNPIYKCHAQIPIQDTRGATEITKTLRELMKGEVFEYVDGPFAEENKELRLKGKAKKDGVVGWVTLKTEAGKRQLEC